MVPLPCYGVKQREEGLPSWKVEGSSEVLTLRSPPRKKKTASKFFFHLKSRVLLKGAVASFILIVCLVMELGPIKD